MNVTILSFNELKEKTYKKEGIVCLGAGGDLSQWIEGITGEMNTHNIAKGEASDMWSDIYTRQHPLGRTDLVFVMKPDTKFNVGIMAIWRLKFGDCSWISDYKVNYKD